MSMTGAYMHVSGFDRSQTYGKFMAQYVAVDHKIYFNPTVQLFRNECCMVQYSCTELIDSSQLMCMMFVVSSNSLGI